MRTAAAFGRHGRRCRRTQTSFTGPVKPTFSAPGGLSVQIPDSPDSTSNFKTHITTLSQQSGMGYTLHYIVINRL